MSVGNIISSFFKRAQPEVTSSKFKNKRSDFAVDEEKEKEKIFAGKDMKLCQMRSPMPQHVVLCAMLRHMKTIIDAKEGVTCTCHTCTTNVLFVRL